jgi:heat-inducible transcriptional repressor
MEERQHNLLAHVVRSYIREAEPIGSHALERTLGVSSATIRNEMAELEASGYLSQPHTSAGRVPTLKGYQFFLEHLVERQQPAPAEQRTLRELVNEQHVPPEQFSKKLARTLAELAGEAAVVGFNRYDSYYTGLSNLFEQPEFRALDMVRSISQVVDHLDEAMAKLYRNLTVSSDVAVKIGEANPFGEDCAFVFTTYGRGTNPSIIGILGPLRMDYDANLGRLHYVRTLFRS